jgi:hypothetical protein
MTDPKFSPGFRLSVLDAAILVAGACGTIFVGMDIWYAGFIIGFSVAHFFLFCNVFRIDRKPELLWAASFTLLVIANAFFGIPGWPITIAASLGMTVYLILREMKKPSYHGIGWRRINPQLQTWWSARNRQES